MSKKDVRKENSKFIKKVSDYCLKKVGVDLLGVLLFLFGAVFMLIFFDFENSYEVLSVLVLWFTAIVVMQYTKETYFLKDITRKNYDLERAPFVVMSFESELDSFGVRNVGRGLARNIEIRFIKNDKFTSIGLEGLKFPNITALSGSNGNFDFITSNIYGIADDDETVKELPFLEDAKSHDRFKLGKKEFEIFYKDAGGDCYYTKLSADYFKDDNYTVEDYKKLQCLCQKTINKKIYRMGGEK